MGKKRKKIVAICLMIVLVNVAVTGCNDSSSAKTAENKTNRQNDSKEEKQASEEEVKANSELVIKPDYSVEELSSEYDKENSARIYLSDNKTKCNSDKVSIDNDVITILKSGTYILQGELSDGRIVVDIDDDDIVRLVLAGASITSGDSAPIFIKEAKETIITLEENTTNIITDAKDYVLEDTDKNEPNAAIFSKDDLTVNGDGTLVVNANYNHGIQSKDNLVLISGTIQINSAGDGIVGKDSVLIKEADITINSGNAGIKGTNVAGGKGYIYLDNPTIDITSVEDGLHSDTVVQMDGGDVTIRSGDDGIHADIKVLINNGALKIDESYEGLEACIIIINDGDITIHSSDDGINASDGSGSEMMVGGMKDGMTGIFPEHGQGNKQGKRPEDIPENEQDEKPEGIPENKPGDIPENEQDEKPEGIPENIPGNEPDETPEALQDDKNNETDTTSSDTSVLSVLDVKLEINGGKIYINAEGDGIDSNGYVVMNGGSVCVDGPQNGGNGALDYDSSFEINGGMLVAVGSSRMAMAPDDNSHVNSVNIAFSTSYDGGTELVIKDERDNEIISYTPAKKFDSFVFSSDMLEKDCNYAVYVNGEQIETFTITDAVNTVGNVSQGMGGTMGKKTEGMRGDETGDRQKTYDRK